MYTEDNQRQLGRHLLIPKQPSFCVVAHNRFLLLLRTVECFEFYIHAVSDESRDSFNSYQMLPFFFVGKNIALNKKYKGVKMILKAFKLCSNAHIYLQADI